MQGLRGPGWLTGGVNRRFQASASQPVPDLRSSASICGFHVEAALAAMFDLLESLLQPLGLIWLAGWIAVALGLWKRRWSTAALGFFTGLLLHLVGGTNLCAFLLARLEAPYDPLSYPLPTPGADAVVMLGGSHAWSRRALVGWEAGEQSDRILTAVELVRTGRAQTLVLGGAGYEEQGRIHADSELITRWFRDWGVPVREVVTLGVCANTRDEAERTARLAAERKWRRVILVSSAWHLPRAEAAFRKAGLAVEPVGADFPGLETLNEGFQLHPVPRLAGFQQFSLWLHEVIGHRYYRFKGWI